MGKHTNSRGIYVDPSHFEKVAAQAILGATLQNENGKGGEEGEECTGGIKTGKQHSSAPLLKSSGNTSLANALGS